MNSTPTVAPPQLALPDMRGRLPLTLARWLAYAEGIILLLGAVMMVGSGAAAHSPLVVPGTCVLAILSLTLGLKVGRGSAPAAMILLGLSISRGVATALPGAPEWWTTMPQLTLIELIVFGLATRATRVVESVGATGEKISARRSFETSPQAREDVPARNFRRDVVIAGVLAVLSMMAMAVRVPTHNEGLQGLGEELIVILGALNFLLAIVLLVSGTAARKGG